MQRIVVGKVLGAHGVRGWLKIQSFTQPDENILRYAPWFFVRTEQEIPVKLLTGRRQAGHIVAQIADITDRDQAQQWQGTLIYVDRAELPEPEHGHYYWSDLLGLQVQTEHGQVLGTVSGLLETGANDVLVVQGERERLVPFVLGQHVKQVDLKQRLITVDWDPDF